TRPLILSPVTQPALIASSRHPNRSPRVPPEHCFVSESTLYKASMEAKSWGKKRNSIFQTWARCKSLGKARSAAAGETELNRRRRKKGCPTGGG
ncbi:unnamed protein product, partial [Linum tenue]